MKIFKIYFYAISVIIFLNQQILAHGGGLNKEGCHNNTKTGQYHCHRGSPSPKKISPNLAPNIELSEDFFNLKLSNHLNGNTEVRLDYYTALGTKGYVQIDIITDEFVIEGGLDKRSSLDSLQQAVFASTLIDRKPAVAIYDTDGVLGKFEHRIIEASKSVNVTVFWVSKDKIYRY